jgi:hypothetical protein
VTNSPQALSKALLGALSVPVRRVEANEGQPTALLERPSEDRTGGLERPLLEQGYGEHPCYSHLPRIPGEAYKW